MISEGVIGIQNTYSLKDGTLTLDIDKATYERCGLVGTVAPSPGRKHVKSRFRIELDLRLPSMQHGKKGFERVKWAFKNVLNESMAWLFVDLESEDMTSGTIEAMLLLRASTYELAGPIAALHPQVKELKPSISRIPSIVPPFIHDEETIKDSLYEEQLLEWLGLVSLDSTRVSKSDTIDSYLCKYSPPEAFESNGLDGTAQEVVHLRWHGFGSAVFVRHVWLILRAAAKERDGTWFSLGGKTFEGTSFTTLCHDGQSVLLWECD